MQKHVPVLLNESVDYLITNPAGTYFDATLGFGGHTSAFISRLNENGKIVATDKDVDAYSFCEAKFENEKRVSIYNTSFTDIRTIALVDNIQGFDGIFADLGVSSFQLDNADSGFTYRENSSLDLRMNKSKGEPAYEFLDSAEESVIADIIYKYGEEKNSRRIAKKIVEERSQKKISTTFDLKDIVTSVVPSKHLNKTLSRVFQALRIYVNNELEELEEFLEKAVDLLKTNGRLVILTYHSLEDRIVKEFFKYQALDCICPKEFPVCKCDKESTIKILTKKPIVASDDEVENNPRSRSAKLRAAEKI